MAAAPRFIRRSGRPLLVVSLFVAGFLGTSFHRIPSTGIGVIRPAGGGTAVEFVEPGIVFIFPLTKRLDIVPLSGTIVMAHYLLGDFNEMKAVEAISADGAMVRLHVDVEYQTTSESAQRIIRQYGGFFPLEYITFETGRLMRPEIAKTNSDSFRDRHFYEEFLTAMSEQCRRTLGRRGIDLTSLKMVRHRDYEVEILPMNPDEIDLYTRLGVLETLQSQ